MPGSPVTRTGIAEVVMQIFDAAEPVGVAEPRFGADARPTQPNSQFCVVSDDGVKPGNSLMAENCVQPRPPVPYTITSGVTR